MADKEPYAIEPLQDKESGEISYRITHVATDSRVATCYLAQNALLVCEALNRFSVQGKKNARS